MHLQHLKQTTDVLLIFLWRKTSLTNYSREFQQKSFDMSSVEVTPSLYGSVKREDVGPHKKQEGKYPCQRSTSMFCVSRTYTTKTLFWTNWIKIPIRSQLYKVASTMMGNQGQVRMGILEAHMTPTLEREELVL